MLLVAHDVNPILGYLDRVVYFAGGARRGGPPREVITSETLSRLYGAPIEVLETSDGRLVVVGQPGAARASTAARHDALQLGGVSRWNPVSRLEPAVDLPLHGQRARRPARSSR